jgi:hypothetical protein
MATIPVFRGHADPGRSVRVPLAGLGHGAAFDVAHDASLDERGSVVL